MVVDKVLCEVTQEGSLVLEWDETFSLPRYYLRMHDNAFGGVGEVQCGPGILDGACMEISNDIQEHQIVHELTMT